MRCSSVVTMALAANLAASASLNEVLQENAVTLSTLADLLETIPELATALSELEGVTILAPSNDAWDKLVDQNPEAAEEEESDPTLLTHLLEYHVLNGTFNSSAFSPTPIFAGSLLGAPLSNITREGQHVGLVLEDGQAAIVSGLEQKSFVTVADIEFDGGFIHVIDTVLNVPSSTSTTVMTAGLTALAGALVQADWIEPVDELEDLTIFAPSNDAFNSIGSAALKLETADVASILRYHVIRGQISFSPFLLNQTELTLMTLAGEAVTIRSINGAVFVNSARVITSDVLIGNGVVHVLDNVLNPAAPDLTPDPTAETQEVAFAGATEGAEIPFVSNIAVAVEEENEDDAAEGVDGVSAAMGLYATGWLGSLLVGASVMVNF